MNRPTGFRSFAGLIGWLAIVAAAAWFGSRFQPGPWYETLARPAWTPPSAVFGPVWTILYIAMAVAAWLVWRERGFGPAVGVFLVQLALNAAWSWLFFGEQRIGLALVDIVLLWAAILGTIVLFRRVSRPAAWLLAPYLLWVTYAATLNLGILRMNA